MAIPIKRFNWARMATGWERLQSWQAKRSAMIEDFNSMNSIARDGFASAWSGQISGSSDLAAQAALNRIKTATATKLDTIA